MVDYQSYSCYVRLEGIQIQEIDWNKTVECILIMILERVKSKECYLLLDEDTNMTDEKLEIFYRVTMIGISCQWKVPSVAQKWLLDKNLYLQVTLVHDELEKFTVLFFTSEEAYLYLKSAHVDE